MIYTIISLDDVFPSEPEKRETVPFKSGYATYTVRDGRKELQSFFSTNPYDYLGKIDLEKNTKNLNRP